MGLLLRWIKDPYTRGHSERVQICVKFISKTGLYNEEQLKSFYYACPYDIGKKNIPDHILTKPGKLTDREFEIIKHPTVGHNFKMWKFGLSFNYRNHHEHWDGKDTQTVCRRAIL